ncbi:putative F-box domain-containing protein [Helianthus annuus]|nr:putative F-box domain-containing protein [Helianthus annuus]
MENLEQHQQSTTTTLYDRVAKKTKISVPDEIIDDILSRLPVKSILRFRSVSKSWLSRISHPSFTKLHSARSTRTALLLSAYQYSTRQQHILSAATHGGPVTHLFTIDDVSVYDITEAQHLNGLVLITSAKSAFRYPYAYVVNPSTRKVLSLPYPDPYIDDIGEITGYCFGFDESTNEHKVFMIRKLPYPTRFEIMIFSLSTRSWRKNDAELPVGFSWDNMFFPYNHSVCVNSVIHLMFLDGLWSHILAYDLTTEVYSVINIPQGALPDDDGFPCIIKANGCIGIARRTIKKNQLRVWMLQDYENRVWVKEICTEPLAKECYPYPQDFVNTDEIIRRLIKLSVPVYNKKSRCFKPLQIALGHLFPMSRELRFSMVRSYDESMVPL